MAGLLAVLSYLLGAQEVSKGWSNIGPIFVVLFGGLMIVGTIMVLKKSKSGGGA